MATCQESRTSFKNYPQHHLKDRKWGPRTNLNNLLQLLVHTIRQKDRPCLSFDLLVVFFFGAQFISGFMTSIAHTLPWGVLLITIWFAEKQGPGSPASWGWDGWVGWGGAVKLEVLEYLFVKPGQLL